MQLKRDKKLRARKVLTKKREAWTGLVEKGVSISDSRLQTLQQLRDSVAEKDHEPGRIFAINVKSQRLNNMANIIFFELARGTADSDEGADYQQLKRMLKHDMKDYIAQGLVVQIEGFVNDFDCALLGYATMLCLPVVVLCKDPKLHDSINKATGNVWHICSDEDALLQYLSSDMPRLAATIKAVAEDVAAHVEKYKHINKMKHGLKRGAVAFIPGGVYAVNFLGIARLVRRMLKNTGMLSDTEAKKAATMEAAVTGIKVSLIDGVGDVYQFVVTATMLAGFATEVSAAGLEAGLASLSALDFALLGSVTVVTGTISAIGAYISRPSMVEAIANLITILQVVCLLNPDIRRKDGAPAATTQDAGAAGAELQASPRVSHAKPLPQRLASGELMVPATVGSGGSRQADAGEDLTDLVDSDGEEVDLDTEVQLLLHGSQEAAPAAAALEQQEQRQ